MGHQILFGVISILGVLAALGTVLTRNLVHAALHLVAFFFIVACQFVMLEAEFLAAVQVLVYIGAVAILLMFGIMLTRNILGDDTTTIPKPVKQVALLIGLAIFAILALGISTQEQGPHYRKPWKEITARPSIGPDENDKATIKAQAVNNMARFVGEELLSRYSVAFETAGLLLTAALVGAIALARQEQPDDPATRTRHSHEADNVPAAQQSVLTSSAG